MEDVCEGKDFSFPAEEERVLKLWEELDAFHEQLRRTEGGEEFIFYDGPPCATGLPHYSDILAGTIKDVVTRHQAMRGRHVSRRFGWDCHGLPVEFEIDKALGITNRQQVLDLGIHKYNETCRSIVTKYVAEWEAVITRSGTWNDFQDDYNTMDIKFMESVWWAFGQLWENQLVYKGFKVMPYSTGCKTALSNFEAGLDCRTVLDPAVMVSFPIVGDADNAALVAWTTTPWTLPSNLALCVNANLVYAKVKDKSNGTVYIVAESRLGQLPVKAKAAGKKQAKGSTAEAVQGGLDTESYELLEKIPGSSLVGKKYTPLFDFFLEFQDTAFRVIADNYVTDDSGTGVVHCAPAFGEDDHRVCLSGGIIEASGLVVAVDDDGCFIEKISEFKGRHVKEVDKDIISAVKDKGRLVSKGSIEHSYPFCWRSGTPLIYRAVPSWFIKVEKIRDQLLECNKETYWVPDYVKEKRFHNWLEGARDWAVSRSRFWGTPLPVWISQDGEEIVVMDSIEKLERLSGVKVNDLHRHHVDDITIPSSRGAAFGVLKRVEDVFDCWFESGSMPYAYIHYPFENRELFEKNFPGNFVAEGLDQTRGWFYTLMVLSTALFGKPAFKNLICNGLVLAEDGKKMSKSKKNYPSPVDVINEYGADALRLYLVNSPVVRAESLRFKRIGVFGVVKDVFLPWYNAYRFLVQNAKRLEVEGLAVFSPIDQASLRKSSNVLDHWINSATESLVSFVQQEMDAYRLYTVVPYLVKYIDNLTNIYVRFNRKRLKGRTGEVDCRISLSTLYHALVTTCVAMAPFTPFFTEVLYQNLRKASSKSEESIHFCSFPSTTGERDERVERSVNRMMTIIDLARNIRERHSKALKTPLKEMVVVHPDNEFLEDITGKLKEYVMEEMNVKTVTPCNDPMMYASLRAEPNFSVLGKRLGKDMGKVSNEVKKMTQEQILAFEQSGEVLFFGHCLKLVDIKVVREFKRPADVSEKEIDAAGDGDVLVILDLRADQSLIEAGVAREVVNKIQNLRKTAQLEPTDLIDVYYKPVDDGSSRPEEILQSQSSLNQEEFDMLCKSLPDEVVASTYREPGAIRIYEVTLHAGMAALLLERFVCELLTQFKIAPEQVMEHGWNVLKHFINKCAEKGQRPSIASFLYFFRFKKDGDDGYYTCHYHYRKPVMRVHRKKVNGRHEKTKWKDKFFYIKLKSNAPWRFPEKWARGTLPKPKILLTEADRRLVVALGGNPSEHECAPPVPTPASQKKRARLISPNADYCMPAPARNLGSSLQEEAVSSLFPDYMFEEVEALVAECEHHKLKYNAAVAECEDLKLKYNAAMLETKKLHNIVQDMKGNIRVFCRCRPLSKSEASSGDKFVVDFDGQNDGQISIIDGTTNKSFKFDKVYTPNDDQAEVYADASPLVTSVLDGYNVCIFAYGQTGSGKTFTMEGTERNRGINYRTLKELFEIAEKRRDCVKYNIVVSVIEIYNEKIKDLLAPIAASPKKLEIKQAGDGSHHVPGIVEREVHDISEVWDVLQAGSNSRAKASNNCNEHSSRSHCMLSVTVLANNLISGGCTRSKLWLVDLAGSERLAKTGAEGDRLKEAQYINKSLSALGDVISALVSRQPHIPYRNSKLTHLLQDFLGGNSKALMLVQISPCGSNLDETVSSLKFASRVRGVELGPAKKQVDTVCQLSMQEVKIKKDQLQMLKDKIKDLERQLRCTTREDEQHKDDVKVLLSCITERETTPVGAKVAWSSLRSGGHKTFCSGAVRLHQLALGRSSNRKQPRR